MPISFTVVFHDLSYGIMYLFLFFVDFYILHLYSSFQFGALSANIFSNSLFPVLYL